MLCLLVIFMVTTQFIQKKEEPQEALDLQLPSAASSEESKPGPLSLVLNKDGDLFLNNKPVTIDDVIKHIQNLQKTPGEALSAIVSADERLTHGVVVSLIDAVRRVGVTDVAVNTKRQEIE